MESILPYALSLAQALVLVIVTAIVTMVRDIRKDVRQMNGKLIALEQWKKDRACEIGRPRICPDEIGR